MASFRESQRVIKIEQQFQEPIDGILRNWHWKENLKHAEIGARLRLPRPTVTRWFKLLGIPSQSGTRFTNDNLLNVGTRKGPRAQPIEPKTFPWRWNQQFFEHWSQSMAYVLGFLMADGYVMTNSHGSTYFCFHSTDLEIIKKIRAALGSNHRIGVRKRDLKYRGWKRAYVLQIGSKVAVATLKTFGVVQNKSLILSFPKDIPGDVLSAFVRGYFDGDGCVYFAQHWRKDRQKLSWIFNTRFISGSKKFLIGLQKALGPFIEGGSIVAKSNQRGYELRYSQHDSLEIYKLMYHNVSDRLFLERKRTIFERAINKLYPGREV